MEKKLPQYSGYLDATEVAEGMNAAIDNATRLLSDAEILFKEGRYPSAIALAILSIEEFGKTSMLRGIALANNKDLKSWWKKYRSHVEKNSEWINPILIAKGARKLSDFKKISDKGSEHPYILDQLKQISFYTDCLGNKNWSIPKKVIDKKLCESIIQVCKILINKKRKITKLEIELWMKHLKPVWMKNMELMENGLINWHKEMIEKGLVEKSEYKYSMEKFILDGLDI